MNGRGDALKSSAELRRKVERVSMERRKLAPEGERACASEAPGPSLHNLRVHQIELEMQNEELRRAQAELNVERARYFDLYNFAPVGYCTLHPEGLILEANLTAATLFGVGREEMKQLAITNFVLKEDQDTFYLSRKKLLESGKPQTCELRMKRRAGEAFWAHLEASITTASEQGARAVPMIRLVMSDISERKRAEADRALLEARLQEAKRLESLGVLAGGMAHDFNNLLTSILGNANLGSLAVEPDSRVAPYFEAIERASLRAAGLTSQLLAYVGKGRAQASEVDLNIILKESIQLLSGSLPPKVTLHSDLADRLPFVKGDAAQLLQVLMNIIVNASESFREGESGLIIIRTRAEDLDGTAITSTRPDLPLHPGRFATFEVTDSGMGMTPDVLARAFEPFFSTKFSGRGLGLAAVEGILRSHQGGLSIRSQPGHGTTFKIFLPAMQEVRSMPPDEGMPSWKGEGQILVVDDDDSVRTTVRKLAEWLGFSVLEAKDGLEGVEAFGRSHGQLALVLLDLTMSGMGGREAFMSMRGIDDSVPIVMSSGYDVLSEGPPLEGLAGVLKKPYRAAEFQSLLQRVLDHSGDLAKPEPNDACTA